MMINLARERIIFYFMRLVLAGAFNSVKIALERISFLMSEEGRTNVGRKAIYYQRNHQ